MAKLLDIKVNDYIQFIELSWIVDVYNQFDAGVTLSIYRSETPGTTNDLSEYDLIADKVDPYSGKFIDNTLNNIANFTRTWFYKIASSTGELLTSAPVYIKYITTDKQAKEILRRKAIALKRSARDFHLLKKRTWGKHCSQSWDETLQRETNPDCQVCYGTGWEGGYFRSISFKGMTNSSPKYNQIMMFGEWKPSDVMLYTLNYPLLTSRDIVVDDEGKRWIVIQVRYLEKLGYKIEQQVQLALISPDDKIYQVPL